MSPQLNSQFSSTQRDLALFQDQLENYAAHHNLETSTLRPLQLALEEHLANLIRHGYQEDPTGSLTVQVRIDPHQVTAVVTDHSQPFDPLSAPEVDTSQPLDAKPIGGLGIHMIRQSVDELSYRHTSNGNICTMTKKRAVAHPDAGGSIS